MTDVYKYNPFTDSLDITVKTPINLTDVNLSVDSPILLNNGSVIDFDFNTANTWTATNTHQSDIIMDAAQKIELGAITDGYTINYDQGLNFQSWPAGGVQASIHFGNPLSVTNGLFASQTDGYSIFGPDPTHLSPSDASDSLVTVKQTDSTTGVRRGELIIAEFIGTSNYGGLAVGLNAFGYSTDGSTGNMTGTSNGAGLLGGRYGIRHRGSGKITLGGGVSAINVIQGDSDGTIEEVYGYQVEGIDAGTGTGSINVAQGLIVRETTGSITTMHGVRIEELTNATNNFGISLDGNNGIYFNQNNSITENVHSPAVGSLIIEAGTIIKVNQTADFSGNVAMGGTTATVGSVPAGASAGQTEWLQIKVDGNTRYIPVWS